MSLSCLQEKIKEQKITKISYDEQWFCKIKEKFEFMINEKEIIVEKINETIEFYIIIWWKRYLIWNILYKLEENSLKMFEFVTANFYNYSYSKKVFEKLHYSEENFISEELYNKVKYKLNYLWLYMMYMLIEFTKKQWFDTFKIEEPVDNTPIILRSSKFRNLEIINCSRNISGSKISNLLQIIDAKIWYSADLEQVKELFTYAIDLMLEDVKDTKYEKYFIKNLEDEIEVQIKDFWDYAVVYQLIYKITNPFYIIKARKLLNIYLQKAQKKYGIEFSTPDLFVETKIK